MAGFAPKKQFSQNFLTDPKAADAIVDALQIQEGDEVLEIGPGKGVLTHRLVKSKASKIVAVDLDPRAIEHLQHEAWTKTHALELEIVLGDALRQNLKTRWTTKNVSQRKVIGNIPYGITSDILFWLFESCRDVHSSVILMQKEVAQRCVAQPRTKDYGILTVSTWFAASAKIVRHVPPGAFFPKPSVTSSVVRFQMRDGNPADVDQAAFQKFVRAAFSQRRKVLSNSLQTWCMNTVRIPAKEVAILSGIPLGTIRAEELQPEELCEMYQRLLRVKADATI